MAETPVQARFRKPSLRKAVDVFQFKYYRYLWISSLFSFTAVQMQQVSRALLAWELTGSYSAIGIISLSFGLPLLLFSLVGGALSDRMEKRNLLIGTQALYAVLAIAHAIPVAMGTMTIELMFVLGLVNGVGVAVGFPARQPMMAESVTPPNVMSAIAMSNAAMNGTRLFGPALAGAMVAAFGLESVYWAQAVLCVLAATTILTVPTGLAALYGHRPSASTEQRAGMLTEIGRGLRYAVSTPALRLLMGMMLVVSLFGMPYILLLAGFVQEDLGQSDSAYGYLQSISGIGAFAASIGIATLTDYERKPLLQWVASLISAAGMIGIAISATAIGLPLAVVATIVLGLSLTAYQTLNNTMLMDESDPEYYGRIMSVNILTFSAMPLMALPLGWLADAFGAGIVFAAMGVIIAVFAVLTAVLNPGYTFGRREVPDPAEPVEVLAESTEVA